MTLRFIDGFDHYNTSTLMAQKWDAASTGGFIAGRFGGNCCRFGSTTATGTFAATKTLDNQATWVLGFACQVTAATAPGRYVRFYDGATVQVSLYLTATRLTVYKGDATLSLGTYDADYTAWHYLEFKVTHHASAGTWAVHLDGAAVASGSGANTAPSGNAQSSKIRFGHDANVNIGYGLTDDLYVCDGVDATGTQGSPFNDFLGAAPDGIRVSLLAPGGAGTTTQFTASAGSNYACVDESPPNDDTDYVSSSTTGQIDTYAMADLPSSSATVLAVQTVLRARKDDAGSRSMAPVLRSGGTDYAGTTVGVADSYAPYFQIYGTNPSTAAWSPSGVNGLEFGPKLIA